MSKLVYIRNSKGGVDPQVWVGPPYCGVLGMMEKNTLGNFAYPSLGGERVVKQIELKDGEEKLGFDELMKRYPYDGQT